MNKQHHFTVCAEFDDEGRPHFHITSSICDPDKPIWDDDEGMWSRVLEEDEENDMTLFTLLSSALDITNRTTRKEATK